MNGEQRRQEILSMLKECKEPVSGSDMAQRFGVSRQIIVQDIALLKVGGHKIFSTYKGYLLGSEAAARRVFQVRHSIEQIGDELNTIVDEGGKVQDVFVRHEMYGELRAVLSISTRKQVEEFIGQLESGKLSPLMHLTDDWHYHTVDAESEATLDRIGFALAAKHYLAKETANQ